MLPAELDPHGKAAEAVRNAFMVVDAHADLIVMFPGHPHTLDPDRRASDAGLAILEGEPSTGRWTRPATAEPGTSALHSRLTQV